MKYMLHKTSSRFSTVRYRLMAVVALIFMAMGTMIGSFEECVPLVPIVVALAVELGWDALTGMGMSLLAAGCGFAAGVVYKLLEKYNRYVAVVAAAIVCPVVNTGVFLLGCLVFFMDTVNAGAAETSMSAAAYLIIFFVGLNFVFELLANIIFSPVILKVLSLRKKHN
jgi:uncharacterized ion transporter superfamily protein YfcC